MNHQEHHHQMEKMESSGIKENHSQHTGYEKHFGHSVEMFKKKFFVSLVITFPILLLSSFIQETFNFSIKFSGDWLVLFLGSSAIFFYGGSPFLKGAANEMKHRVPGMMTLIALAISVAYFYGLAVTFGLDGEIFFWELATLIDIMLLGHWIEMRSIAGASKALTKLSQLIPEKAHIKKGADLIDVDVSDVKSGDVVLVKPGERIPIDGVVVGGESFVNESMITGESNPVAKNKNSKVIGGSINENGSLEIRLEIIGGGTYLSKIMKLVKDAQISKSKTQLLADKAAFWLTIVAIAVGVITFVSWIALGESVSFAIERTATVFVIACPHALGLAIPLVVSVSTVLSAQNGLLIKNRTAFESARLITTVIFDKTGTLTKGVFELKKVISLNDNYNEDAVIQIAESLERNSEHPIAKAVTSELEKRKIEKIEATNFKAVKGKGVEAFVGGKKFGIISPGYLRELGITTVYRAEELKGTVAFIVILDEKPTAIGVLNFSDTIRNESFEAVRMLRKAGLRIWMLTGDNESAAKSVSDELKLDGYFSGVLPNEKQEKIKELQEKGEYVAMVGDGINDAPALAQANVGIAIGSGTDIAAETADIILVNNNPKDVASLISFGKVTFRKMIQNLIWATGYNVIMIPLAAGVLIGYGIMPSPAVGAILMSLSTVIVAINAKTLKVSK